MYAKYTHIHTRTCNNSNIQSDLRVIAGLWGIGHASLPVRDVVACFGVIRRSKDALELPRVVHAWFGLHSQMCMDR